MPQLTAQPRNRLWLAYALLALAPAMMSVNYVVSRAASGEIDPHLLALVRWSTALLLMLPLAWRELAGRAAQWRAQWRNDLLLGALGMWICGAWVYQGAHTTSAANIGLIYATAPVLIALGSAYLFGERLSGIQRIGIAMALLGTLWVIVKGSPQNLMAVRLVSGDLWIAAAVLSWAAYALLLRRLPTVLSPLARLTTITAAGVVVLIAGSVIEWAVQDQPHVTGKGVVLGMIAGVFPGFGAYLAHAFVQRELGTARTSLILYLAPLWGALFAWIWLGEALHGYHVLGAALILPGIALANHGAGARTTIGTQPMARSAWPILRRS